MSIYDTFLETYPEAIDAQTVPETVIQKYEAILPEPIISLWKKHGFGGYDQGLFWTINPDEYLDNLQKWLKSDYDGAYPIMRTAFGDLIFICDINNKDKEYSYLIIKAVDIRHCEINFITFGLEGFFKNYLMDIGRLCSPTNIDPIMFFNTSDDFGILKSDQCYGFEPILAAGGKEKEKNIRIWNFDEYLRLSTRAYLIKNDKNKQLADKETAKLKQIALKNLTMDKNLHYAILDELERQGLFKFDIEAFFKKYMPEEYDDSADYNYEPIEAVEYYLQGLKLSKYPLKKIEELSWAAYSELISHIWNHYDGEDNYFEISSLEGIEVCPNLKKIFIEYQWNIIDLTPLGALKKLEELTVLSNITVDSLKPLLELPALKKVKLEGIRFKDQQETDEVVAQLKGKGVKVQID